MRLSPGVGLSLLGSLLASRLRPGLRRPLVLMLEPTMACNLRCASCGKVRRAPTPQLTPAECLAAVDECGAPVVSIAGGEPLLLPGLDRVVRGVLERGKLALLCTNGLLAERALPRLRPDPRLVLVFHLDGLRRHHDTVTGRPGTFAVVMRAIEAARRRGFRVATNTTLFPNSSPDDVAALLRRLMRMGVDSCIVSPAYDFAGDGASFLSREAARRMFHAVEERAGRVRFYNTPMYLDFLRGKRDLRCTPWGTPTRHPLGWASPCYLIADRHYDRFVDLVERTPWEQYGYGRDPRCAGCAAHAGHEATGVSALGARDLPGLLGWMIA